MHIVHGSCAKKLRIYVKVILSEITFACVVGFTCIVLNILVVNT